MGSYSSGLRRLAALVAVNVVVGAAVLASLNLFSKIVIDHHAALFDVIATLSGGSKNGKDSDAGVYGSLAPNWMMNPNYTDPRRAAIIFDEFDQLDTEYRPFIGWSRMPFKGQTITVDDSGDRIHSSTQVPRTDLRVARFFGGSTQWGTGSGDDHTIPALFERMTGDYQVFNHGETGFNSRQSVARLVNVFNQGERAGLVVFYDGGNEIFSLCRTEVSLNGHLREAEIRGQLRRSRIGAAIIDVFLKHTVRLVEMVRQKLGGVSSSAWRCASDPSYARQVARTMINNWAIAHDLSVARGGRFIGLLQPVAYMENARVEHLRNNLTKFGGLREEFEAVYPIMRKMIADYDYMYDLTGAFDVDEIVYIDFCHVSSNGNRIIAAAIQGIAKDPR